MLTGQVTLVISPALLGELARLLAYPKLAAVFDDPAVLVAAVTEAADTVDPAEHVTVLADEPGNRVLEAAAAGRADLIVTGDKAMQETRFLPGNSHRLGRPVRDTTPAARSHRATRPERADALSWKSPAEIRLRCRRLG